MFRPIATAVTAGAVLLFVLLGNWQLGRAAEKRALDEEFSRAVPAIPLPSAAVAVPRYQRVTANGSYDSAHQFLLDNMSEAGRAGVHVLTPLLLADGSAILVDRGWAPFGATRDVLPDVAVAGDAAHGRGAPGRTAAPRHRTCGARRPAAGRAWSAIRAQRNSRPCWVASCVRNASCSIRRIPTAICATGRCRERATERHLGYAIQWYAFAATAVAIWIALGLRRRGEKA